MTSTQSQYSLNQTSNSANVKSRLADIQSSFSFVNKEITDNLKFFDDIILENKQTFQTLNRNLDDVQKIYEKDIQKFDQNVDKGISYNESLYNRVQKDIHYLHNDQDSLRKKINNIQKRIQDMEAQIGNLQLD